ncbi:hypothetical protein [Vibrio agarivorans]|uniref:DM13 domain-containing protein n=1 Tax=Vibrio agarivorans TaxID=153622 RepID=A0ABT7XYW3_9VIBR|nr:hypothetical protein [Vibrio agarivorans]MDN2480971.1 hypothetical protein [Vibrio agarivorans]
MLIGNGNFIAGQGHELNGSFTLTKQTNGILMLTSDDFFFDGSPAPGWALSKGTPLDASNPDVQRTAITTDFQRLTDRIEPVSGQQSGLIPNSINIDEFDTLFLWCYQVPFILGYGVINRVR